MELVRMGEDTPPEVVVEDETKKKAVRRAAKLLDENENNLSVTVIQQGSAGFLGFFSKPWKIKVKPKHKKSTLRQAAIEDALEATESVSGSFSLKVEDRNILLTVYPPEGSGDPVDPVNVINHLEQIGLEYCDFDRVRSVVEAQQGTPREIGQLPEGETIDTEYEISFFEDGLEAKLRMKPPRLDGDPPSVDAVEEKLEEVGITKGIKWDVIEEMVENRNYNEPIVIAEGRPPEKGQDGYIEYNFDTEGKPDFKEEGGRVDFREMGLINNVSQNELLAEKNDPSPGRPGMTVKGEPIDALDGEDVELKYGDNVHKEDDRLYSEIDGQVVLEGDVVRVFDVHKVEGDVDYSTGNIEFDGTVHVKGNIKDRFRIQATGDIIVEEGVDKAYLESEQNIMVQEGIRGKGEARINAGGSIMAEFVEQANLMAKKNVLVSEMILHSNCDVGEGIYLTGGRGLIAGGKIRAGKEVFAKEIGSIGVSETRITVGIDPQFFHKRAEIGAKMIDEKEKLDKVEQAIAKMEKQGELSESEENKLDQLKDSRQNLKRNLSNFKDELENITLQSQERPDAQVMVDGKIFDGTRIEIGQSVYRVRSTDKEHCGFRKFKDNIETVTFQRPDIPSM